MWSGTRGGQAGRRRRCAGVLDSGGWSAGRRRPVSREVDRVVGPVRAVEGVAGQVAGGGGQLAGGGAGAGARAGCGGRAWRRRVLWAVACEPGSGTLQDVRRGGGGAAGWRADAAARPRASSRVRVIVSSREARMAARSTRETVANWGSPVMAWTWTWLHTVQSIG